MYLFIYVSINVSFYLFTTENIRIEFHSGCVKGDPERNGKTGKRASCGDMSVLPLGFLGLP